MGIAVAVTNKTKTVNQRVHDATVTFNATYAVGGETITANSLGLGVINSLQVSPGDDSGIIPALDGNDVLLFQGDYSTTADGPLVELTTGEATGVVVNIRAIGY